MREFESWVPKMYRGCPTQKICCRFTGFSALNLCENGEWVESYEQALTPYDAGTDSGESFLSEDAPTSPFEPIIRFSEIMPQSDNIFYDPATYDATRCPPHALHV